jgi:DNA-binding MarR family transcriptional regulator
MNAARGGANSEDVEWVGRLARVIDEFRKINQDITANQMLVLLRIGEQPGITQRELSERTQLRDGTISRICALMSERGHQGREGLNVVEIRPVPDNYRSKGQHLIGNGKRLYTSIKHMMAGK